MGDESRIGNLHSVSYLPPRSECYLSRNQKRCAYIYLDVVVTNDWQNRSELNEVQPADPKPSHPTVFAFCLNQNRDYSRAIGQGLTTLDDIVSHLR